MILYLCQSENKYTVTSRLFTHIVSTEKSRKDMRNHKETRGIKHTYYDGSFLFYCF